MSSASNIRIGFVGTGWSDRVQIPVFQKAGLIPQAICSGQLANAQRVAQKHGIPEVYATWQELIQSPNVDVVSVCSPPATHTEITVAALAAGKHIICEKPTALNVGEAEAMLAAAQAAPNRLAIIDHELRFDPARIKLRQLVKDGFVGTPLQIHLDRLGSERLNAKVPWNWLSDVEQGGGMMGALGSHLFDEARWIIGRVEALTAQLQTGHSFRNEAGSNRQLRVTADDYAHLLLRFVNGVQGQITCSAISPGGYGMTIRVTGTEGALLLDNQDRLWGMKGSKFPGNDWEEINNDRNEAVMTQLAAINPAAPMVSPFTVGSYYLGKALAAALQQGDTNFVEAASLYDGLVVQRSIDAARRSANEQSWVNL